MKSLFFFCFLFSATSQSYFYPESYIESREHFLKIGAELSTQYPSVTIQHIPIPTQTNTKLFTDAIYIPQQSIDKKRLLIITSGIHGVEAFTGSAIQIEFLRNTLSKELLKKMGILIVHVINPYGFYFKRRVSENNVDLNRNFSGNKKLFTKHSKAYEQFSSFLNPQHPLKVSFLSNSKLFAQSLWKLAQHGKKNLAQVAVGGQYQSPKGIYYGGQKLEPNVPLIKKLFLSTAKDYQRLVHIDLHTGYGKRGQLHFFSNHKAANTDGFDELFAGFKIDLGSDKDFYKTTGSFDYFSMNLFPNKKIIPMTFEFGTMDSQTIMGGFYSLRNMIYENQGFHFGYANERSQKLAHKDFMEMFNPSDQQWRSAVVKKGASTLETLSLRFGRM